MEGFSSGTTLRNDVTRQGLVYNPRWCRDSFTLVPVKEGEHVNVHNRIRVDLGAGLWAFSIPFVIMAILTVGAIFAPYPFMGRWGPSR